MNTNTSTPKKPFYKNGKFWIYFLVAAFLATRVYLDFYSNYFLVIDVSPKFGEINGENGIGTSIICQIDSIKGRVETYKVRRMAIGRGKENDKEDFGNDLQDFNPYSNTKIFNLVSVFNVLQMLPFGEMKYIKCSFGIENDFYTNQIEINKRLDEGGYKKIRYKIKEKSIQSLILNTSRSVIKTVYPNSYLIYCVENNLNDEAIKIGKVLSMKYVEKNGSDKKYLFFVNLLYSNAISDEAYKASLATSNPDNYLADDVQFEMAQKAMSNAERILNDNFRNDSIAKANFYFYNGYFLLKKQNYREAYENFEKTISAIQKDSSNEIIPFRVLTLNNLAVASYNDYLANCNKSSLDDASKITNDALIVVEGFMKKEDIVDERVIKSTYRVYEYVLETKAEILFLEFNQNKNDRQKLIEMRNKLIKAAQFGTPISYEICKEYPIYQEIVKEYNNLCDDSTIAKEMQLRETEVDSIKKIQDSRKLFKCNR